MKTSDVTGAPSTRFFEPLLRQLAERSASSIVGIYGPRTAALRRYLVEVLGRPAGEEGGLLADPVFEAIFEWKRIGDSMANLAKADFLADEVVGAMDTPSNDSRLAEYRFSRDLRPFTHQMEAWRLLKQDPPQSVLITSGTGSGKTEGFLVPIMDDLVRKRANSGRLRGVRALFLYPLNALINSQRDRLTAWLRPFDGDIRYCLYKGDTPERMSAADRRTVGKEEVPDRLRLRKDPPPILVTNATMLEYMLIRADDGPIIEQSRGQLRWIVLDEAHTYLGSRSAELALLLRRVLHAFDVRPQQVRFIATSATIGSDSSRDEERLRQFLADLAGVSHNRSHVVRGRRKPPLLPVSMVSAEPGHPSLDELRGCTSSERGRLLATSAPVLRMREALLEGHGALSLTQLARKMLGANDAAKIATSREEALKLLDLSTDAVMEDGTPFLRLRGHFFHRSQGGIWTCISGNCPGRAGTALDDPEWIYGKLFFERRERCDTCHSLVLEVVLCRECGTDVLAGSMVVDELGRHTVRPNAVGGSTIDDEYGHLDHLDDNEDSVGEERSQLRDLLGSVDRYLARPAARHGDTIWLDVRTGRQTDKNINGSQPFREVVPSPGVACPECGSRRQADQLLRPVRAGASLILRSVIPVVLQHTSPRPGSRRLLPSEGRRLLTFTDSRQGTARFALGVQIEAERNWTRGFIYHSLVATRTDRQTSTGRVEELQADISELEGLAGTSPALVRILEEKQRELAEARTSKPGQLTWTEAVNKLAQQPEVTDWMRDGWHHLPLSDLEPVRRAEILLLREFARRPKRQNSLETLGFVAVEYEGLSPSVDPPAPWRRRKLPPYEWRNFLKLAIDFGVRGRRAINVEPDLVPWLGVPHRPTVLAGPDGERLDGIVRWPRSGPKTRRSILVQLLARTLGVDPRNDRAGEADINECLFVAWKTVRRVLTTGARGKTLDFRSQVLLREVEGAWLCPVTRRVLDTVVAGVTPYVVPRLHGRDIRATAIRMPRILAPFWRKSTDETYDRDDIEEFIRTNKKIRKLRDLGVWQGLSSRIIGMPEYHQVAEHSAQLVASRLQHIEGRFRDGKLNVMSCSTTMEMGVDIGGLSAVAMNNAPPGPANYLQRVGRAGRRTEKRAFSLTLCNTSAHGEFVFRHPLWPFTTESHVTQVSLGSERIVQRHVNALALTRFFSKLAGVEVPRLTASWFFEACDNDTSMSDRFRNWLDKSAISDPWMDIGIKQLLRRSVLEGTETKTLLKTVADEIREAASRWMAEADPLIAEMDVLEPRRENDPVRRALDMQLHRLREEYLLRELALRNFLPGYGFPTQVVPFVTTTAEDLRRRRRQYDQFPGREDNISRTKQYPSRDLSQALLEFAPGSAIVVDGRVLQSSGLTLNWKIPASDESTREIQALRFAWRCGRCGKIGVAHHQPGQCDSEYCEESESPVDSRPYIEPAGFAVDIRYQATNDLSKFHYTPARQPWIATSGEQWQNLARPELGRWRYSTRGHVFAYTDGEFGNGFAVCLQCGRAASEPKEGRDLPEAMKDHKPMRGGTAARPDGRCRGNDETFTIRRRQWLGVSRETDVLELQLRCAKEGSPPIMDTACSIAVALREALARKIGIEDQEIGWAVNRVRVAETGEETSIVLYDTATGGAGFVAQAGRYLRELMCQARSIFECPRQCDKSCHACLLSYDTHRFVDRLDRNAGLRFLSESFLDGL